MQAESWIPRVVMLIPVQGPSVIYVWFMAALGDMCTRVVILACKSMSLRIGEGLSCVKLLGSEMSSRLERRCPCRRWRTSFLVLVMTPQYDNVRPTFQGHVIIKVHTSSYSILSLKPYNLNEIVPILNRRMPLCNIAKSHGRTSRTGTITV